MKRRIRPWGRLSALRPLPPSRRRAERQRRPGLRLDVQLLEPRLALAAAVTTKATSVEAPLAGSYNAGDDLVFKVHFSGAVTVSGAPVVNLVIGKTTLPATYVGGSGTSTLSFHHVVAAEENDADGVALAKAITLPAGATLVDANGQAAGLALKPPARSKVIVDTSAPTVVAVAGPANKTYATGDVLSFTVKVSEAVTASGPLTLPVKIGTATRDAVWNGKGSGTKSLVFSTTVQTGDAAPSGVSVVGPIGLSGGAVLRDAAGNDANPAAAAVFPKAVVDAVGPSVASFGSPMVTGTQVSLQVTFSEPVGIKGKPFIPFTIADAPRQLVYASGSGKNVLTFRYKPTKGETATAENVVVPMQTIALPTKAAIVDKAGNVAVSLARPADIGLSATSITENAAVGSIVGTLSTSDMDGARDRFAYTLVSGDGSTDNASFTVVGSSLEAAAAFDYEAKNSYSIRIRATDSGGLFTEKAFTVAVTDANDLPPVFTSGSTGSVTENAALATPVYTAVVTDADGTTVNRAVTFSIKPAVGDADLVQIDAATGIVTLKAAANYEAKNSYAFTVVATNTAAPGLFAERSVTVAVTNTLEVSLPAPASGIYRGGDRIPFVVTFDRAVTLVGAAVLSLDVGGLTRTITLADADRTGSPSTLTFNYVVQPGDEDGNGPHVLGMALTAGSTLKDSVNPSVDMPLTLPAVDTSGIRIDTVPTVVSLALPAAGSYGAGDVLTFTVTFTEPVSVSGIPVLRFGTSGVGGLTWQAAYDAAASTSTVLLFRYTVLPTNQAASGVEIYNLQPSEGGSIRDLDLTFDDAALALPSTDASGIILAG